MPPLPGCAPVAAPCMRRPYVRSAAGNGDGLGGVLSEGLRWLNWDTARAYGAGKGLADATVSDLPRASDGGASGGSLDSPNSSTDGGSGSSSGSGATSVSVKDPAKLQRIRDAFDGGSLAFGFSAGGLMFPYYVGVCSALEEMGALRRGQKLAGASAGSLIAAAYNAGLDMRVVEESMILFGEDCLANGTQHRLGPLLRDFLHAYLPPDAHERCSGTTHVAITRALPFWRPQLISHFKSRDDLIDALMTSCHIPWYFDGRWMTKFRGHYAVDGGATNFIPVVPGAEYTCKVMCFPTWHLEAIRSRAARLALAERYLDIDISLDSFEEWEHGYPTVIKWALQASTRETSSYLIEKGKRDARSWVVATGLADVLAERSASADASRDDGGSIEAAGAQERRGQEPQVILPHGYERREAAGAAAAAAAAGGAADGGGGVPLGAQAQGDQRRQQQRDGTGADAGGGAHMAIEQQHQQQQQQQQQEQQEQQQQQQEPEPGHHGHKRRRGEGEGKGGGGDAAFVPGLTGQLRTDTEPMHKETPA